MLLSACSAEKSVGNNVLDDASGPGGTTRDGGFDPRDPGPGSGLSPDAAARESGPASECPASSPTTVSGKVYAPTRENPDPLYNAIVFVPSGKVEAFKSGAYCDKCGSLEGAKAVASALTGADGKFTMKNVPSGTDVPFVVQIGRWRRQVTIPNVKACVDNPLPPELTRLPRNQKEGDIPLTALATGNADSLECILRKIGIDDAEFTPPGGPGRIHFFTANGARHPDGATTATALWDDAATLKKYDLVLLPCEGRPTLRNKSNEARQAVVDYTSVGGRVFVTHYSYVWIYNAPPPFPGTAKWRVNNRNPRDPLAAKIDASFPKGAAFADWLQNVGATTTRGELAIHEPRHDADATNGASRRWIYSDSPATLQHYTFNTPVGAKAEDQCGRVVYSDFHVVTNKSAGTFPRECRGTALTPQEKALEFMLFDLASCVQKDDEAPKLPPIK